jgi:Xaa-Pro aminopeptidase
MDKPGIVDLSFLHNNPLLNRARATEILKREGLSALLVAEPANVFYLTNHWPLLARMGSQVSAYAILSADPATPIALVMGQFSYYYGLAEEQLPQAVQPFLYTGPGAAGTAAPAAMFRVVDPERLTARERARRVAADRGTPYAADALGALRRALRELRLRGGSFGVDGAIASDALTAALPIAGVRPAGDTLRRIRRVKSAAEVQLMRLTAQNNADAALAAARATRKLGSVRALRMRFYSEAAQRGLRPVFMVIDGVTADSYDEPLRDGQAVLIDCVASLHNYHGDYARTLLIGEPNKRMQMATRAIAICWEEIRATLKPGVKYSAIRALGNEILKKNAFDVQVGFSPHSVGLWHGDDPRSNFDRSPLDPELEEGMILSVDCPMFDTGVGGSAHLEDLSLITAQGAELINSPEHRTIQV